MNHSYVFFLQDMKDLEKRMIDHDHFVLKTKGFLTYENQKRGSEWYQVSFTPSSGCVLCFNFYCYSAYAKLIEIQY